MSRCFSTQAIQWESLDSVYPGRHQSGRWKSLKDPRVTPWQAYNRIRNHGEYASIRRLENGLERPCGQRKSVAHIPTAADAAWLLMIVTVCLTLFFGKSDNLAAAYG